MVPIRWRIKRVLQGTRWGRTLDSFKERLKRHRLHDRDYGYLRALADGLPLTQEGYVFKTIAPLGYRPYAYEAETDQLRPVNLPHLDVENLYFLTR